MFSIDNLLAKVIKSPMFRARILAFTRHVITSAAAGLVAKGYIDDNSVQCLSGFAVAVVSFYLSQNDVTNVDVKVKTALNTPVPESDPFYNSGGAQKH